MKKKSNKDVAVADDDLEIPPTPPEFFKKGVTGKYYAEYALGGKMVRAVTLDKDVADVFKNARQVNEALRLVVRLGEVAQPNRKKTA